MIKSFLVSMFAVMLFALGATGAWFYMKLERERLAAEESLPEPPTPAPAGKTDPVPAFTPALPASHRGSELTPEELYRLETATSAQRAQLAQYERRLREQNRRIITSNADTEAAQREVEGAIAQLDKMMTAVEELLSDVATAKEELKQQTLEVQKKMNDLTELEKEAGAGAAANIRTFAEFMTGMPPAESAALLVELANDGKIDFALQLLHNLETRNASKVLAEVRDGPLRAEMATRFRDMIRLK